MWQLLNWQVVAKNTVLREKRTFLMFEGCNVVQLGKVEPLPCLPGLFQSPQTGLDNNAIVSIGEVHHLEASEGVQQATDARMACSYWIQVFVEHFKEMRSEAL